MMSAASGVNIGPKRNPSDPDLFPGPLQNTINSGGVLGPFNDLLYGTTDARRYQNEFNINYDLQRNAMYYKVQDLRRAGLHPTLAAGNVGSMSSVSGGSFEGNKTSERMQGIASMAMQAIQSKLINAQTEQALSQAHLLDVEAESKERTMPSEGFSAEQEAESRASWARSADIHEWATQMFPHQLMQAYESWQKTSQEKSLLSQQYNTEYLRTVEQEIKNTILQLEKNYMESGYRMPTKNALIQEAQHLLESQGISAKDAAAVGGLIGSGLLLGKFRIPQKVLRSLKVLNKKSLRKAVQSLPYHKGGRGRPLPTHDKRGRRLTRHEQLYGNNERD